LTFAIVVRLSDTVISLPSPMRWAGIKLKNFRNNGYV